MSLDPPGRPRLTLVQLLLLGAAVAVGLTYLWGVAVPEALKQVPEGLGPLRHWDLETYFLPKFVFGSEEILRGHLPLWNRFEFGGIPFLATAQPSAVYVPKILVFALWDAETALWLYLIGHFALIAILFLVLMREQGIGPLGAFAGVLFCTFNAPLLLSAGHPMEMANMAWVPLIFLLGERVGRSPSIAAVAGLSAAVAIQLTAGYPAFAMNCGLLLGVHAVACYAAGHWTQPPWKTIPLLGASFVLGAMLAGIQVVPLADLVLFSGRLEMADEVAFQLESRAAALAPRLLLATVVFALPALLGFACVGASRRGVAVLAGVLTCAFMQLGGWRLLRLVPGFSAIRLGGTWPLLIQFFLAWLVAWGADRFLARAGSKGVGGLGRAVVGGFGLVWTILCLSALLPDWVESSPTGRILGSPPEARVPLVIALGAAGGLLLALFALGPRRVRESRALAMVAVGLLLAGHLSAFPFGRSLGRMAPPEIAHRSARLIPERDLRKGRVVSLFDLRGGFHLLDRVENPFGREGSLPPPRFSKLEKHLGVSVPMMGIDWEELARSRGLLETLDARFLVMPRPRARSFARLGFRDTGLGDRNVAVLEAEDPLGRAWGVYAVTPAGSPEAALDLLLSPGFDPRRQVILESSPRGKYPPRSRYPPSQAQVRYLGPRITEVEIEMQQPGLLVLADACFPGWNATVDGRPAELFCANYLVRGVELEAGRHLVRFEYRPASVSWGAAVSAITLIALAAMLVREAWRGRRHRAAEASA